MDMANNVILALVEFLLVDNDGGIGGTSARLQHKPVDLKQLFELEATQITQNDTVEDTNENGHHGLCFLEMAYKVISAALKKQYDLYDKEKPSFVSKGVRRMFVDVTVEAAKLEWSIKNGGSNDKVFYFDIANYSKNKQISFILEYCLL